MVQAADRPSALSLASQELQAVLAAVDETEVAALRHRLTQASRIFVTGQGRSGLSARMAAMRLMHLGLTVHVVGDVTTPSIGPGPGGEGSDDVLLVLSGSGSTQVSLAFAERALDEGAQVLLVTHTRPSPLDARAAVSVLVPARASVQFGGTLFEQAALVVLDAVVADLMATSGVLRTEMAQRHANLQ